MPLEETKSQKILRLYERGDFTIREIADAVGCRPEYVRVVARQRKGCGSSEIDKRYRHSPLGRTTQWRLREARAAYTRTLYRTGCHEKARRAYRKARLVQEASAHA